MMQQRGFYPMVAAQRLGGYTASASIKPRLSSSIRHGAHASQAGDGAGTDQLEERFPLAYNDLFARYVSGKDIPQSYAMAIARQESARNPKVRSPVGASGLMQIMPGTATHTVSMFSIPGYSGPSQLLDPETNINIGTSYLQYVYQQFGNNRIYASAAYNAGPGRVRTWQGNSAGRIDAVAFVESIPFSETRGYVKNVLSYDAYYRYFMGQQDKLFSDTEWRQRY
ncbi:hypothetical protein KPZU09_41710 [Klebsiella pneumoniae]|uniref:peptidoglycan lytic exotransglycosylase n=1 Tax=Klebsiella pneumoniae TaxID=573 RepID=A0A919HV11_KLEPN|nr:hypothetical protein KPZU09_41710 [Klebsiella pneumoniae]